MQTLTFGKRVEGLRLLEGWGKYGCWYAGYGLAFRKIQRLDDVKFFVL